MTGPRFGTVNRDLSFLSSVDLEEPRSLEVLTTLTSFHLTSNLEKREFLRPIVLFGV